MSLADVTSSRSSPSPEACPECDTSASVTSDMHKYQVACTCKPSAQYACAEEPGPPPPAKSDVPPALPPRPPASALAATNRRNNASVPCPETNGCRRRKYAWWCVGCGALAAALGGMLAAQHILLRAYTASPHHLETVPAAVPAAMLVLTGVCIMSLARRRNRYSYMIKVVGACCLVCALTCVLVTITTTVIHMNKLQTLKFCEFTKLTRTCTCFSMPPDLQHSNDDEGSRCVFEGVSSCGVVHGALYWCLRGVFALSVTAVLVCIFSSMLAYQLLSHERKKMYWEQLELRCRSLYRRAGSGAGGGAGAGAGAGRAACGCCDCHALPASHWDAPPHRFWAPGRIGNLYSPNPGTMRKTSAWSWFPWPRSNSQNSRSCRTGVPQSGDSAYGFCETDNPQPNSNPNPDQYEDRQYPANFTPRANFQGSFGTGLASGLGQGFVQEGYGESSGSFDVQTGVWGPPPPYSPQGRSGSRHHLHQQDPAAATLLHHHHIDVHRNSMQPIQPIQSIQSIQTGHPCRNSSYIGHLINTHEMAHLNPELAHLNPEIIRLNPDLMRLNPEMYPEVARMQLEMARMPNDGRFNTLRGHLVPYPSCQRTLGLSMGNLHRDCRMADDNMAVECLHQKSGSKVSDQASDRSDTCQKLGKENLAFQNDKHSPVAATAGECRAGGVNLNAESEVYFADVSSCCNVSVKADCCMNPGVSLVGTIENHPESTSESDTGSFTLTRQQRPQPQAAGSKRRPRMSQGAKNQDINTRRLTEQQIEMLNSSLCQRMSDHARMSERMNDSRGCERMNDSRSCDRMNDSRACERMSDPRGCERMNDSRGCERMNDSRGCERMNDPRVGDRLQDSRMSERMSDSRVSDRMNDSRISERLNDSRISDRMQDTRMSDRMNDSRVSERMNDSRITDIINDTRMSDRMNDSRMSERMNDSRLERMHESRISDRMSERHSEFSRMNEMRMSDHSRLDRVSDHRMDLDLKEPKLRGHMSPRRAPLTENSSPIHPRQSSTDSNMSLKNNPEFFVPPPPNHSPLSPNTEETLLSEDENDKVYTNEPETSKCLGPDAQYEPVKEKEDLKVNHHHCYSDTNTMDSGWQSGSEKHATD